MAGEWRAWAVARGHAGGGGPPRPPRSPPPVGPQSLGIAAGLGVVSAAVLHTFAEPLLCGMGADPSQPEMFGLAKDYLLIRSLAAPAVFIMMAGQGAFRGMKDTATPLAVTLAANAINFTLDLVFIMG